MSTTDEVYWSDDVEVDKEEESLDDTVNRQGMFICIYIIH